MDIKRWIIASALVSSFLLTWCTKKITVITDQTWDEIHKILNSNKKIVNSDLDIIMSVDDKNILNLLLEESPLFKKSLSLIWKTELNFFLDFFKISTYVEFEKIVMNLQAESNSNADWIIWKHTLEYIYLNYYNKSLHKLPENIKKRLEIYSDISEYDDHYRVVWDKKYYPLTRPNVFDNNKYFWELKTENLEWTYIDESLVWKSPLKINQSGVTWILEEIDWKFSLAIYEYWNLTLHSYVSPWRWNEEWYLKTPKWNFTWSYSDKLHITAAKASIKNIWDKMYGAVMPYSVNIINWYFAHSWSVNWERRSHWCVRLPLFYADKIYDIFKESWEINWVIKNN